MAWWTWTILSREEVSTYMDDSSDDECKMDQTDRNMTVPCSAMDR